VNFWYWYIYSIKWGGGGYWGEPKIGDYRFKIWQLGYSGFYIDEVYNRVLEKFLWQSCTNSVIFIFDRWFSELWGVGGVRQILQWFITRIYYERLDVFTLVILLGGGILGLVVLFGFIYVWL